MRAQTPVIRRAVVDGQLFVAGGLGAGGQALSTIEIFHPSNNSWTTFARLPYARSNAGCAASGNKLIIAGGRFVKSPVLWTSKGVGLEALVAASALLASGPVQCSLIFCVYITRPLSRYVIDAVRLYLWSVGFHAINYHVEEFIRMDLSHQPDSHHVRVLKILLCSINPTNQYNLTDALTVGACAGTNGTNGADLAEVWAVDSSSGTMTRLANMLYPRFDLQLVSIPGSSNVLAVGGGQHVNGTEVSCLKCRPSQSAIRDQVLEETAGVQREAKAIEANRASRIAIGLRNMDASHAAGALDSEAARACMRVEAGI